jgi:cell division protein FtsI (penicillin-binding protein 3)
MIVSLIALAVIVQEVGRMQLGQGARLTAEGEAQRANRQQLSADRGVIFDRDGSELALSVPQTTVWADPKESVGHETEIAAAIGPILHLDPTALTTTLINARGRRFVYIARQIPDSLAAQVKTLLEQKVPDPQKPGKMTARFPGVATYPEPARFYPAGDTARAVIGATDVDGVGQAGVEAVWDKSLTGTPGELQREVDTRGRTIPAGQVNYVPPVPGTDVGLTIDRSLQYDVEQALLARVAELGAKSGVAIVMVPQTGDILAMANVATPTPDPANPTAPLVPYVSKGNAALVYAYEPGSVNKVITASAAVEEGLASPSTLLPVPHKVTACDKDFLDHSAAVNQQMSLQDIITQSSNTGTISLAQRLGKAKLDRYLRDFGLGSRTALNFPNESAGLLMPPSKWTCTSLPTFAIGQGVAVTPMQMAAVYATIANGGVFQPARLVDSTIDANGVRHQVPLGSGHRVVSRSTATQVTTMLQNVVEGDQGTGHRASVDGYHVAGKTGTALKPQPGGGYVDINGGKHYFASFVGFAPAEDPKVVVFVGIDEPSTDNGHYYASYAAAPLFHTVVLDALQRLRVPPKADVVAQTVTSDGPTAGDLADAGGR